MFTLERIRARHFTKAWGFVQGAKSIPVLLGVPITGYINQIYPKSGYYFSFISTIIGASLMFLVGTKKEHVNNISNCNLTNCNANMNECVCNFNTAYGPEVIAPCPLYRQGSTHYERVFPAYDHLDRNSLHRHSYKCRREFVPHYLPKSLSYAANIEYSGHPNVKCISHGSDMGAYKHLHHNLRPSRSVPEGLARWGHYGSCRRPIIRNVQVIEQITTSV